MSDSGRDAMCGGSDARAAIVAHGTRASVSHGARAGLDHAGHEHGRAAWAASGGTIATGRGRINAARFLALASLLTLVVGLTLLTAGSAFATGSVTAATGGSAISADTAGGTFTTLTGPAIVETDSGGMSLGSMILTTPSGFGFDTTANSVTVTVTCSGGTITTDAQINTTNTTTGQGLTKAVTPTTTTITIWITRVSTQSFGTRLCTFTWSGIRVRPTSGTPLASGNITYGGTATGVSSGANMGTLTEVPGAIASYTVTAASPQAPFARFDTTVTAKDQFNNTVTTNSSTVVTMTSSTGHVQFDGNGDGTFGDNTKTLAGGTFTIKTRDTVSETVNLTATDGNAKTGTLSGLVISTTGWFNCSWLYRKAITIDSTKVPNTDQPAFPVLISLPSDSDLSTHARGDGFDILFTSSDGVTKIAYEREKYASGALVAWVLVASLSHTADTVLYMYYGNSGAADQQDTTQAVWDANYVGVWHLKEATGATSVDSASTNNLTPVNSPAQTTGQIGGGLSFVTASNTEDNVASTFSLGTANVTMEAWVNLGSASLQGAFIKIGGTSPNQGYALGVGNSTFDTAGNNFLLLYEGARWIPTGVPFGTGWHHAVMVINASGFPIAYLDGGPVFSDTVAAPLAPVSSITHIGGYAGSSGEQRHFGGILDEVRISNSVRSADWIKTEFNNQSSPSTFYGVDAQQLRTCSRVQVL